MTHISIYFWTRFPNARRSIDSLYNPFDMLWIIRSRKVTITNRTYARAIECNDAIKVHVYYGQCFGLKFHVFAFIFVVPKALAKLTDAFMRSINETFILWNSWKIHQITTKNKTRKTTCSPLLRISIYIAYVYIRITYQHKMQHKTKIKTFKRKCFIKYSVGQMRSKSVRSVVEL